MSGGEREPRKWFAPELFSEGDAPDDWIPVVVHEPWMDTRADVSRLVEAAKEVLFRHSYAADSKISSHADECPWLLDEGECDCALPALRTALAPFQAAEKSGEGER